MTISELIKHLQEVLEQDGDMEVLGYSESETAPIFSIQVDKHHRPRRLEINFINLGEQKQ